MVTLALSVPSTGWLIRTACDVTDSSTQKKVAFSIVANCTSTSGAGFLDKLSKLTFGPSLVHDIVVSYSYSLACGLQLLAVVTHYSADELMRLQMDTNIKSIVHATPVTSAFSFSSTLIAIMSQAAVPPPSKKKEGTITSRRSGLETSEGLRKATK